MEKKSKYFYFAVTLTALFSLCPPSCSWHPSQLADEASNLGILKRQEGHLAESKRLHTLSTRLMPSNGVYYFRLGNILNEMGDGDGAIHAFASALRRHGHNCDVLNNLANVYSSRGDMISAMRVSKAAIQTEELNIERGNHPCAIYAGMRLNLGGVFLQMHRYVEARHELEAAVRAEPNMYEAWNNYGNILKEMGEHEEALTSYEKAYALNNRSLKIVSNIVTQRRSMGVYSESDDRDVETLATAVKIGQDVGAVTPFWALALAFPLSIQRRIAAGVLAASSVGVSTFDHAKWKVEKRIREVKVGFLTSDVGNHIVGRGLNSLLGRLREYKMSVPTFRPVVFSTSPPNSDISTQGIARNSRLLYLHDDGHETAGQKINAERLDVLFDMNGWTKGERHRILLLRPAPIQALLHGFAGTTGGTVDYIVADKTVIPPDYVHAYTERVLLMEPCFFLLEEYASEKLVGRNFKEQEYSSSAMLASASFLTDVHSCNENNGCVVVAVYASMYKTNVHFWREVAAAVITRKGDYILWIIASPLEVRAIGKL